MTACLDWGKRLIARESIIPPPLFPEEAASAIEVFNSLKLVDVYGSPTMGEVARPWITDFAASIFGSYDTETGRRMIREFFLLVSKKNSKSTTAASIMLTALIRNWRHSAEFIIVAPTVEIANNSFYPARDMVRADEDLSALLSVQDHVRTITHRSTNASLKVLAADSNTVSGKKATGVLIDEAWLFGKQANAGDMLREAMGGLASRPEGFAVYLSTQSDKAPAGVFAQKLEYARAVRDGKIDDPQFLPVLYEFPKDMIKSGAFKEPENFYITNPNMGASVDEEFILREYRKAEYDGDDAMQSFMAKHLNIQIDVAAGAAPWAGATFWEACKDEKITLEYIIENSEVIEIGGDGGGMDDLLGLAVAGRLPGGVWAVWNKAWAHPVAVERRKQLKPQYEDFERAGEMSFCDVGQDLEELREIVGRCEESGKLDQVGLDPHATGMLIDALTSGEDAPITEDRIIGVSQGWKLTSAIKTTERRLAGKTLLHGGQKIMSWCVGNAKVEPRGNAILVTKSASGSGKIDPLMATFNAVMLLSTNPEARGGPSVYETRGLIRI